MEVMRRRLILLAGGALTVAASLVGGPSTAGPERTKSDLIERVKEKR
jgi:hypothetical protein